MSLEHSSRHISSAGDLCRAFFLAVAEYDLPFPCHSLRGAAGAAAAWAWGVAAGGGAPITAAEVWPASGARSVCDVIAVVTAGSLGRGC